MPIKIRCACGNLVYAPEERVGETGQCPNCNRAIKVEAPTQAYSPSSSPTTSIPPRKLSWFTKLLNCIFYLFFLLLLSGFIALHVVNTSEFANFNWFGLTWFEKEWQSNINYLLEVKEQQQQWAEESWYWAKSLWPATQSPHQDNAPATSENQKDNSSMIEDTQNGGNPNTPQNTIIPGLPPAPGSPSNNQTKPPRPKPPTSQPPPKTTTASANPPQPATNSTNEDTPSSSATTASTTTESTDPANIIWPE